MPIKDTETHINEVVYRHKGTIIQWSLDAFNLMSNTGNKVQSAVAIATKITFVGVLHLEIHKKKLKLTPLVKTNS